MNRNLEQPQPRAGGEPDTVRWGFAGLELDEATRRLSRDGSPIEIERKPYEVLRVLLRHAGEVVTKDELAEQVWTRRVMNDQVIARTASKLRGVLGDTEQKIVKTVYGHGYQLAVPVRVVHAASPAPVLRLNLRVGDVPPLRPEWRLVEALGAGGFGEVWLGRHDPGGETRVFKFAADGPALSALKREVTLFRLIREGLPQADRVVQLLGWNFGQAPYFTEAEFVAGGNLELWTQAQGGLSQIPLATRLDLVAQMADVLAAVHGLGVLHKDLKPANVLVASDPDDGPQVKLCDFGSGRVLDDARLEALGITRQGFTPTLAADSSTSGTLRYIAPEVLNGEPPTARADIYALGVMLYQLVVGDFREGLAAGWERRIEDPLLREDIGLTADGDPAMRLADASLLAGRLRTLDSRRAARSRAQSEQQEIERLRADDARRRARRPWVIAAAAALILGLAVSALFGWRTQLARSAAERDRATLQTVNRFLAEDLIAAANPFDGGGEAKTLREVLDQAAATVAARFAEQPAGQEVAVRLALGRAYSGMGAYDQANAQFDAGVARAQSGGKQAEVAQATMELRLERIANAVSSDDRAAARRDIDGLRALPALPPVAELWCDFYDAELLFLAGQWEPAVADMQALEPRFERLLGPSDHTYWDYLADVSLAQTDAGHWIAAVGTLRRLVAQYTRLHGAGHALTLDVQGGLGMALVFSGHAAEGLPLAESAWIQLKALLPPGNDGTRRAGQEFGMSLLRAGDTVRAEAVLLETLGPQPQAPGGPDPMTRLVQRGLAEVYLATGRAPQALAILEPLVALAQTLDGPKHPETLRLETLLDRARR